MTHRKRINRLRYARGLQRLARTALVGWHMRVSPKDGTPQLTWFPRTYWSC